MVVYTYDCQACKHTFDALVASNREQPVCPMCQSSKTRADPVCRPSIRPSNKRRRGVFDMSSGSCPCGCNNNKRARAAAGAM